MNAKTNILSVGAAVVALFGATLATAPDASARSMRGCDFPRVCFYKTQADFDANRPTAAYKDVTSGFQKLGSQARGSVKAVNSRNDDGAIVKFANKPGTVCVQPSSWWHFGSDVVTHIRIVDSPNC
ncbi:hypothetical protein OYE22_05840 [Streptomyces sp. 71268]|uniref:hypothetical protein n=1 Tax=Streptomyces sp. 71268 TaxID=3002640 RepID=UPI0023F67CDD|nr:hypothetical protein [Streptomyces sp. 71268]WEV24772.1 hypothetical protein OYE22_05840 [Streptomyces sp. 71268]